MSIQIQEDTHQDDTRQGIKQNIQKELDDIKNIMINNIEKLTQNQEKIESLIDKSESLMEQSKKFNKNTKSLRWRMYINNKKTAFILGSGIIFLATGGISWAWLALI